MAAMHVLQNFFETLRGRLARVYKDRDGPIHWHIESFDDETEGFLQKSEDRSANHRITGSSIFSRASNFNFIMVVIGISAAILVLSQL
jgi:hypothetical protein